MSYTIKELKNINKSNWQTDLNNLKHKFKHGKRIDFSIVCKPK